MEKARFAVGDKVRKHKGYPFPGVIVAVFTTTADHVRVVVEATGEDYQGMLHIFSQENIEVVS